MYINRYLGGLMVRIVLGKRDKTVDDYAPSVTVVIPLYNEAATIEETLRSVLASDYADLRVVCVDDSSTDDSFARAAAVLDPRLTVLRNPENLGKRASINHVIRTSDSEIIVSIDSDVIVDRDAIRQLVRRFTDPRIAAVGGWVDVRNKHDNWLTRMQVLKYWFAYYVVKNVERAFRQVLSVSGCLAAYRRSVLVELLPVLEDRNLLGMPIKYGEDRFLTRQILKAGYLTTTTLAARCRTFVPKTLGAYFAQQLRWRRSNLVDYAGGVTHMWKLHPLVALNYFAAALLLVMYPLAVVRAAIHHQLFWAIWVHLSVLAIYGAYYRIRTRAWPAEDRVGALSYVPHALVMPITSGLLLPLALFTLYSTSWETRVSSPAR
jgi:cellulose synthase/poly-beta-1,6-N-acetylglucosamine synthase-like glycosyltransferase